MKRSSTKIGLILAVLWCLVSLVPFLVAGEWWGSIWYLMNLPVSEFLKMPLWDFGIVTYTGVVTALNTVGLFLLVKAIAGAIRASSSR